MRLVALALCITAAALSAESASSRPFQVSASATTFDTCDVLTARQVQSVLPGTPRVADNSSDNRHVANVCDYSTKVAHVGGEFSSQLYSTREGALQGWDQFVATENATPKSQKAAAVRGVGEHAFLQTTGGKSANRSSRIFWLQGRYVFQVQLQASGTRKAISAATLTLGKEAAAKLKNLVD